MSHASVVDHFVSSEKSCCDVWHELCISCIICLSWQYLSIVVRFAIACRVSRVQILDLCDLWLLTHRGVPKWILRLWETNVFLFCWLFVKTSLKNESFSPKPLDRAHRRIDHKQKAPIYFDLGQLRGFLELVNVGTSIVLQLRTLLHLLLAIFSPICIPAHINTPYSIK